MEKLAADYQLNMISVEEWISHLAMNKSLCKETILMVTHAYKMVFIIDTMMEKALRRVEGSRRGATGRTRWTSKSRMSTLMKKVRRKFKIK